MKRWCWLGTFPLVLGAASASAQSSTTTAQTGSGAAGPGLYANSWALVIGINAYQTVTPRLNYAVADARAVAEALPALGFPSQNIRVLLDGDATKARIETVLYRDFRAMGSDDRLLVFFAGHGETLKVRGGEEGYLLPVDADPQELPLTAIPMDEVKRISQRLKGKHYLFVMDACFSGFALTRDIIVQGTTDEYLAAAIREPVIQVLTAGRKGEKAIEEGGHGLFTRRLLDGLRGLADPEGRGIITATQLAAWIEPRVVRDSKGKMTPQYGKLDGEGQFVFLRPGAKLAAVTPSPQPPPLTPTVTKEVVKQYGSLAVLGRVPGIEVWVSDQKIGETEAGIALVVQNLAAGPHRVRARKTGHIEWERDVQVVPDRRSEIMIDIEPLAPVGVIRSEDGAEMVMVAAGEFWMGSDVDGGAGEQPRHKVFLDGFYIDRFEVTNGQYKPFLDATARPAPMYWTQAPFNGAAQPVIGVTWHDAEAYCRWAGKRLPTEAEWEKAARGTDGRKYPWGDQWDQSRANSAESQARKTVAVGSHPSGVSPYGAHDMAGNVWEWVADWYDQSYYQRSPERNPRGPDSGLARVLRGGAWLSFSTNLRAVTRLYLAPDDQSNHFGFRCVKEAR